MKPGTQADLIRHLASEYNIKVSRNAISLLVKAKDYRILKTPQGKIKIEETAKTLVDSGFGKRSELIKRKKGKASPSVIKESLTTPPTEPPATREEIDSDPLTLESPREKIERHKAFHQSEKERINNEEKLKKLIDVIEVGDKSFNLWRQVRDEIQALKDRIAIKVRAAETDHEAEQIVNAETHRILSSIVDGYQELDDDGLKKKLVLRLIK